MASTWTPGPWRYNAQTGEVVNEKIVIASVYWLEQDDGRLIAAAPDLLAALEGMLEPYEAFGARGDRIESARAAVAKATGGTP